jgi:hypothetical protein
VAKTTALEKLGNFEDFMAPWETDAGESEIVKPTLKKYIFGLLKDKATAQDARAASEAAVTEAEAAKKDAEAKLAAADSSGELARLQAENAALKIDAEEANLDLARIKVGDEAGLTIKQSLRLQGKDEDELKADAEDILETFGVKKDAPVDETDEEREEREELEAEEAEEREASGNPLRRAPLRNPADRREPSAEKDYDIAKIVASFDKRVI